MDQDFSEVFIPISDYKCEECGESLQKAVLFFFREDDKLICLKCAGLDLLVRPPDGDATIKPVVYEYSTQDTVSLGLATIKELIKDKGIPVPVVDLKSAKHKKRFATRIRELFPHFPAGEEHKIADYFCEAKSGRVGSSTSDKPLDTAVKLAVAAYARHTRTNYDKDFIPGTDKFVARDKVIDKVIDVSTEWESDDGDDPA